MATTVHKYIDTDAAGAATGNSWADAYTGMSQLNGYAKNLVTADELLYVHVRGSTADTTAFSAAAWVTDATRYILIEGETKLSSYNTSAYRLESDGTGTTYSAAFDGGAVGHIELKNIQLKYTGTGAGRAFSKSVAGTTRLVMDGCICSLAETAGVSARAAFIGIITLPKSVILANNVFDSGNNGESIRLSTATASSVVLYNNTLVNASIITINGPVITGSIIAKNNIFDGGAVVTATHFAAASDYNASTRSEFTAQAHSRALQTFSYRNEAGLDYRLLKTDAGAKGFGVSLTADADYPFAVDAEGGRRGTTWDIGADQITGFDDSAIAGKLIFKGYEPVEDVGPRITTELPLVGKWWFRGGTVAETTVRITYKYVDPAATGTGSGDDYTNAYTTLNAVNGYAKNLVTADESLHVYIRSSDGTPDTTVFVASSLWTTDATHTVTFECVQNHGGKWNTSIYRLEAGTTSEPFFAITGIHHAILKNLQIKTTSTWDKCCIIFRNGTLQEPTAVIENCLLWAGTGSTYGGLYLTDFVTPNAVKVANTVVFRAPVYAVYTASCTASSIVMYNNTFDASAGAIGNGLAGTVSMINNIFKVNVATPPGPYTTNSNYNSSRVGEFTAQANSRRNQTFMFVNTALYDYRLLKTDAGAKGFGVNLAESTVYPFDYDLEQARRGVTWDIGADQVTGYDDSALVGKLVFKGGAANDISTYGHNNISGKWVFKGGVAEHVVIRTTTKTTVAGQFLYVGYAPEIYGVVKYETTVIGKMFFKGNEVVADATKIFRPSEGVITFLPTEGGGEQKKTNAPTAGKWIWIGWEPRTPYVQFTFTPPVAKWQFKTYEAVATKTGNVSFPIRGIVRIKGTAPEANQDTATKLLSSGKWSFVGLLPEANIPGINAPVIAGKLSFLGGTVVSYSGAISHAVVGQWQWKGYEPVDQKQKYNTAPNAGKFIFAGKAAAGGRWINTDTAKGMFHFISNEINSVGGFWVPVKPDAEQVEDWTPITPDRSN